jgi:hypothetical protein
MPILIIFDSNLLKLVYYIISLFVISTYFHNQAYKNSPKKEHLALFYFMLSIGGALGGIFIGVVAPLIFNDYYEFYIMVALILFLIPFMMTKKALVGFAIMSAVLVSLGFGLQDKIIDKNVEIKERTFFGLYKVKKLETKNYKVNLFTHGTTIHGAQTKKPILNSKLGLTYYSKSNGLYESYKSYEKEKTLKDIGVVGLGIGSINCFSENKNITFYEIDQVVVDIAKNENYFTYLSDCKNNMEFLVGDARIKMQEEKDSKYDLLFIDAFSSDAIPTHLITKEAISMYLSKIKEEGNIVFHISNRYLNLEPVIGNIAKELGVNSGRCFMTEEDKVDKKDLLESPSEVVVIGKDLTHLKHDCWVKTLTDDKKIWTDGYSNLFDYIIW